MIHSNRGLGIGLVMVRSLMEGMEVVLKRLALATTKAVSLLCPYSLIGKTGIVQKKI